MLSPSLKLNTIAYIFYIFRNRWIESKNQKLMSHDPALRAVQAWKNEDAGFQMYNSKIILQRLITSSIDVYLHFNQDYITVIGRILLILTILI